MLAGFTCPLRSALELSRSSTVCSSPAPFGLVSSQWHSWGSHLQGFSLLESRDASPRPLPSCRSIGKPTASSGSCSLEKSVGARQRLRRTGTSIPSWFWSLQGSASPRRGHAFTHPPPVGLWPPPRCGDGHSLRSLSERGARRVSLETTDPPGVYHLMPPKRLSVTSPDSTAVPPT